MLLKAYRRENEIFIARQIHKKINIHKHRAVCSAIEKGNKWKRKNKTCDSGIYVEKKNCAVHINKISENIESEETRSR